MKCGRCGKNFDEGMYSGICPKCGHFNNRQTEYDVSKYFSARFDDGGKTSTSAQAAKQHDKLHEMYDKYNMHKPAARQWQNSAPGQAKPYDQRQNSAPRQAKPYGQRQNSAPRQAKPYGEEKRKGFFVPACVLIMVLAVAVTAVSCRAKRQQITERYYTLDYERQTAGEGELFEMRGRLLMVKEARAVEMSGAPAGERLVAVSVEILPADEESRDWTSDTVYVFDGVSCKEYLNEYVVMKDIFGGESFVESNPAEVYDTEEDISDGLYSMQELMEEEILTGYNYLDYSSMDGKTGNFYFLVDEAADEITISFDRTGEEGGISVLQKRVSVPLRLKEDKA